MSTCIDLKFIQFGDCKSPSSTATIDLNNISKNVSESIMNSITEQSSKSVSVQRQNVIITGNCCSTINVSQNTNLKVIDVTKIDSQMISNILGSMKDQYNSQLDNIQPNMINLMGDNIGKNVTTSIKQSIEKAIENSSVKYSLKKSLKNTIGSQTQNVNIQCSEYLESPGGTVCNIDQTFLLQQTINNVFEDIFKEINVDPGFIDAVNGYTEKKLIEIGKPINEINTNPIVPFWKNQNVYIITSIIFLIIILRIITKIIQ
jgi:hypothetical protein